MENASSNNIDPKPEETSAENGSSNLSFRLLMSAGVVAAFAAFMYALLFFFPKTRCGARALSWDGAYVVTKYADMPALLLESGFATNGGDAKNLTNSAWQDQFASAVADGIRMYLLEL